MTRNLPDGDEAALTATSTLNELMISKQNEFF
jgi:hypothetical protein